MPQYEVNTTSVQTLLSWISSREIAIPEIQRPFVWDASKVRDLIDSLYKGFPVGYIIIWRSPDVRTKSGQTAEGRKILIDGQQRITAADLEKLREIVRRYVFDILGLRDEKAASAGGKDLVTPLVNMLLDLRQAAKTEKNWALSDKIRDELTAIGIRVKDRKDGCDWEIE